MGRTKQIENGKKINFILSGENQKLLKKYKSKNKFQSSLFFNEAVKKYFDTFNFGKEKQYKLTGKSNEKISK